MSYIAKLSATLLTGLLLVSSCQEHHSDRMHRYKHNKQYKPNVFEKNDTMKIEIPNRKSYTYEQTINGSIETIMPLYCPVRELEWCENWNPEKVISKSGVVEKDCIFITTHGKHEVTWIVTDYNIERGHVEMYYLVPDVIVTKLEIQLAYLSKEKSKAVITYSKTALGETGNQVLEEYSKESYDIMMDSWEKAMNHFLKSGEMLTGLPNF